MLRSLQKKFTAHHELINYAFFVLGLHALILIFVCLSSQATQPLIFSIKKNSTLYNTRITWTGTTSARKTIQAPAIKKKKIKKAPVIKASEKPRFTPINLGPKKKKPAAKHSVIKSPVKKESEPVKAIPEPVVEPEQLVLNLHEFEHEKDILEIIDAVRRWWQPPLGLRAPVSCSIKVKVSSEGTVQEIFVEQSSGVPAYDIAAKGALLKSLFPKKIWGKECVFQF